MMESSSSTSSSSSSLLGKNKMEPSSLYGDKVVSLSDSNMMPRILVASGQNQNQKQYQLHLNQVGGDIVGENMGDWSGENVAFSGDGTTLVVSAKHSDGDDGQSWDVGQVKVYRLSTRTSTSMSGNGNGNAVNGVWTQVGQSINGEANYDRAGNSVAVSKGGDVIAVGATFNDGDGRRSTGHIRVYKLRELDDSNGDGDGDGNITSTTSTWVQMGDDIDGEGTGNQFGFSVSLSDDGNTLVGGSIKNLDKGLSAGHARVFQFLVDDDSWNQVGSDIDGRYGDQFGYSVSLSGDGKVVAIGAPSSDNNNAGGESSGRVSIFEFDEKTSDWALQASLGGDAPGDYLGARLFLSNDGSTVVAAATQAPNQGPGYVQAFHLSGKDWVAGGKIDGGDFDDSLSIFSIASSGDCKTIAVSASSVDLAMEEISGEVRIFNMNMQNGVTWDQHGQFIVPSEVFDNRGPSTNYGYSVSLSQNGDTLALGVPFSDKATGHVKVFMLVKVARSASGLIVALIVSLVIMLVAAIALFVLKRKKRKICVVPTRKDDKEEEEPYPKPNAEVEIV